MNPAVDTPEVQPTEGLPAVTRRSGPPRIRAFIYALLNHYVFRRFIFFLFVVWVAATVIFIIPRLSGQDPVKEKLLLEAQRGGSIQSGLDAMAKSYQKRFGLDKPLLVQYRNFLYDIIRLDFGPSIAFFPKSVNSIIADSVVWTLGLLGITVMLAFSLGSFFGALLGWPRAPRYLGFMFMPLLTLTAIPAYLLGIMLIFIFAFQLQWFPLFGAYPPGTAPGWNFEFIGNVARHAFLPGMSIILVTIGFWAVGMRGMMVTTQGEDFMIQSEAKGLKGARIFFRYGLRNAILPQITGLAIALGTVLTGFVIVEVIFVYPGLGNILFQAIRLSDFFVIRGIVFTIILMLAAAMFVVDIAYPLIDPRVRYRRA